MLPTALIPVRIAPTAKHRLAHVLGPDERIDLVRSLFEHVLAVTLDTGLPVIVLSPTDIEVPESAEVWKDEEPGLNRAIGAALRKIGTPVLVVHADLPFLSTSDIERVLSSDADVVIARAHDGGTNGLLLRKPLAPAFGRDSALAHAAGARSARLRTEVIDTPGFAQDVDDERSLGKLSAGGASFPGRRP